MSRSNIHIEKNPCVPEKSMHKGTDKDVTWKQLIHKHMKKLSQVYKWRKQIT